MKTRIHSVRSFEFYVPDVDTLVLVESSDDQVIIRATRNTFPEQRKTRFLRELAAEGFIPDRYQWVSSFESQGSPVSWLVDSSWMQLHECNTARTRKYMFRLLFSAALLFLVLMSAILLHWI